MVKILVTMWLVQLPQINVYGAIIGTVLGYITAAFLNIYCVKIILKIKINFYNIIIKPAYASVMMIILVVFLYTNVYNSTLSNGIACFVAIVAGIILYIILILRLSFYYDRLKKDDKKKFSGNYVILSIEPVRLTVLQNISQY